MVESDASAGPACDHSRGTGRMRGSAITVCRNCRDYLCSICGLTIEWYEGLRVTNPVVQWRYCGRPACIDVEAAYHGCSVAQMVQYRDVLRAKRLQPPRRLPQPPYIGTILPGGAERVAFTPPPFKLDPGEACWCSLGKDCTGSHEIGPIEVVNRCGLCGQTFRIESDDPHWSTGRGPICPTETEIGGNNA